MGDELHAPNVNVSLREYIEQRISDCDRCHLTRLVSLERAQELSRETMNARLCAMNEFRGALKDQVAQSVTRQEHEVLVREIQGLRESRAEMQGKASQLSVMLSYGLGVIGILFSVWSHFDSQAAQAAQAAQAVQAARHVKEP